MGIFVNALSITTGSLLGNIFAERIRIKNLAIFGISIMIISMVSFLENIFNVTEMALKSDELILVVFSLITGTMIGDTLQFETKISNLSGVKNNDLSGVIDSTLFFGIGGLQICGPILLATAGDSSQLILKSVIDFPFALMFGMSYGKRTCLSTVPVAICQILIVLLTKIFESFLDAEVVKQLCAMGYIVLFFSGFNLMSKTNNKINNVNMIISLFYGNNFKCGNSKRYLRAFVFNGGRR